MTLTIQQAIDTIIASVPGAPFAETVDVVKVGDASRPVSGIAVTFLASGDVIEQALQLGANLIITHEPIFYNHLDKTDWLADNAVYQAKRRLIEQNNLVIWRFHDYLHSIPPDSTLTGLARALEWEAYLSPDRPYFCQIPPTTFRQLVDTIKGKLGLNSLRVVGDLEAICQGVAMMPGFPGLEVQIGVLTEPGVDVLITGEIHEWETSEYVRDALQQGEKKGLLAIGHAASEEPGIKLISVWLQERLPGIPIHFVPVGQPFLTV